MSFLSHIFSRKKKSEYDNVHPAIFGSPLLQLSHQHQILTKRPLNIADIESIWNAIPYWAENYYVYNRYLCKYDNCITTENGVIFNETRLYKDTVIYEDHYAQYSLEYLKKSIEGKTEKQLDDKNYLVIYNYWSANYFHWVLDNLVKLIAIEQSSTAPSLTLLIPENAPSFVLDSLSYFNFPIQFFKANEYVRAKNLLYINNLSPSGLCHPMVKEIPKKLAVKSSNSVNKKRIYVSRGKSSIRFIVNDSDFIGLIKKYGFEVVYNEDYTFEQQIALFKNADVVIAPHGAGLTNTLFMNEGSTVIEIGSENILTQPTCYWNLSNMMALNYYYIPTLFSVVDKGYVLSDDSLTYIDSILSSL